MYITIKTRSFMKRIYSVLFSVLFVFLSYNIGYSEQHDFHEITYNLEANQVSKTGDTTYLATGNVELKARDVVFYADQIEYNSKTQEIVATGNVKVVSPEQELEAEEIQYNIETGVGSSKNIKGFLAPYNYICAKKMDKTSHTTFTVEDAKISTCSGALPDWSVSMHNGELKEGGYLHANHATANVLDTPLLYVPKIVYPVFSKRKSGFLIPNIAYTSKLGAVGNFRYFIAPDVNYDFTLGLGLYSERGVQEQVEARFALSDESQFYLAAEHIKDFGSESGSPTRWRGTLKNKYTPFKGFYIDINGDYASDYLYSRDFNDYSISAFNSQKTNMYNADARVKYYNNYANIEVQTSRDLLYRDTNYGHSITTLDHLPSVKISNLIKDIPYIFFQYELSYDRLVQEQLHRYNKNSKSPRLEDMYDTLDRFYAFGKLFVPIDFKVLTLTPSFNMGYVRYENSTKPFMFNDYTDKDFFGGYYKIDEKTAYKYYGGFNLSIALNDIYRDFGTMRHTIKNLIELSYSPNLGEHDYRGKNSYFDSFFNNDKYYTLPGLDNVDYYTSGGLITYNLINIFDDTDYNIYLKLSQSIDFLNKDNIFLPLNATLRANLFSYVNTVTEIEYNHSGSLDTNETRFPYFYHSTTFNFLKYLYVEGSYTYDARYNNRDNFIKQNYNTNATLAAGLNIWRFAFEGYTKWQAFHKNLDVKDLKLSEYGGSVLYNAECWSLGGKVAISEYNVNSNTGVYKNNEIKVYILLSLKGLGETSTQIFNSTM